MSRSLFSLAGCTLGAALLLFAAPASLRAQTPEPEPAPLPDAEVAAPVEKRGTVDLVFCIDCSGSMAHAMGRAKQVVAALIEEARTQYPDSEVRVGFIRYGDATRSYRVFDLTSDPKKIRENLGGTQVAREISAEYVGTFLDTATGKISWGTAEDTVKRVFVVGNETAAQGPVDYRAAARHAANQGIQVGIVYCPLVGEERDVAQARAEQFSRAAGRPQATNRAGVAGIEVQKTWLTVAYLGGGEAIKLVDGPMGVSRFTPAQVRYLVEVALPAEEEAAGNARFLLDAVSNGATFRSPVRGGRRP
jgi:hypothetical protein